MIADKEENEGTRMSALSTGKIILQKQIDRAQVVKLLETGKTDLLPKFISKKGRPFSAFLVYKEGKVGFEFAPREPKAPKGKAKPKEKAPENPPQGEETSRTE